VGPISKVVLTFVLGDTVLHVGDDLINPPLLGSNPGSELGALDKLV